MDQQAVLIIMVGMLVVTYLPRLLPVLLFSSRDLPPMIIAWLRFVPVAVLSAMLLPSLVLVDNQLNLRVDNIFMWAAIPTFLVALKTRSLLGAVVVGMGWWRFSVIWWGLGIISYLLLSIIMLNYKYQEIEVFMFDLK